MVALAREGENGVGSGVDFASDASGEVHAEKRETRIGHGIDESAHQRGASGQKVVVLAAERDDYYAGVVAGHAGDAVTVEAGTVDHRVCGESSAGSFDDDFVRELADGFRGSRQQNVGAACGNQF